jgi:hypothetical protein
MRTHRPCCLSDLNNPQFASLFVRKANALPLGEPRQPTPVVLSFLIGMARFGGEAGIAEFKALCWITVQTQPLHHPV